MNVVIIGGGIAGLAAAHYLEKKAAESGQTVSITVLESADYWGGKIKTIVEDKFVIEGGPDAYLVTKPWMRALCKELGLESELHGTSQEHTETFILNKGMLTSIPTGLTRSETSSTTSRSPAKCASSTATRSGCTSTNLNS